MYSMNRSSNENIENNNQSCKDGSCSCKRCERTRKYKKLLDRLTSASNMVNYEEQIYDTVSVISTVYIKNNLVFLLEL